MNYIEFKEWVETNPSETNFMMNLKSIIKSDVTLPKHTPLIVAGINAYMKSLSEAKAQSTNNSEWVGSIGEKIETDVILVNKNTFETVYGWSHCYKFIDECGNILVWFSASELDMLISDKIKIKGTVKTHDFFNSKKQTILTRVKKLG